MSGDKIEVERTTVSSSVNPKRNLENMTSTSTTSNEAVLVAGSANEESLAKSNNNVTIPKHPILMHKISMLRSSSTNPASFRQVLREITYHLGYEATLNDLNIKTKKLTVPVGNDHITCEGKVLTDKIALVPILRSGLGMVDSMLEVSLSFVFFFVLLCFSISFKTHNPFLNTKTSNSCTFFIYIRTCTYKTALAKRRSSPHRHVQTKPNASPILQPPPPQM